MIRLYSKKKNKPTVIVAESDPYASALVVCLLEGTGTEVVTVQNGREAVAMCHRAKDSIVLAAADLPDLDAASFLREARSEKNRNLFLMMVEGKSRVNSAEMIRRGAWEVLAKPIDAKTFPLVIRRALAKRSLHRNIDFLKGVTAFLIVMIPLVMTAGILLALD